MEANYFNKQRNDIKSKETIQSGDYEWVKKNDNESQQRLNSFLNNLKQS